MDLSIIIVNYNTKVLLRKCLDSIAKSYKTNESYEVVVVDNGSRKKFKVQSSKFKDKYKKLKIKLIENKDNVGFGRANNQAAEIAKGKYLLFLNTDIEVMDGVIEKLLNFIKSCKNPAIVGGKLYNADGTEQSSCGPFYSLSVTFAMLFLKGDLLGITRYSPQVIREVDWVSGACFIIKKTDFLKVNGFDEQIFMYMEDVELMYRARKMGFKILFYPDAHFIHLGAATSKKSTSPIINIYKGLFYVYKKHFPRQVNLLKWLLRIKAVIVMTIANILHRQDLFAIYAQAYKLIR